MVEAARYQFLPTLSIRRATVLGGRGRLRDRISTHALHTESDVCGNPHNSGGRDFYPRSPYGERRSVVVPALLAGFISTHALHTESDGGHFVAPPTAVHFYPRSPYGERQLTDYM